MKILFVLEHSGVGPLLPALRQLHDRGHTIRLALRRVKSGAAHHELQALVDECGRMSVVKLPSGTSKGVHEVTQDLRLGLDSLRYRDARYRDAPKLRARAEHNAPEWIRRLPAAAEPLLRAAERALPPPPAVTRFLEHERPDVVLVTPLVDFGSRQADWLRAAKRLGIRSVYPVYSWDNLTNKGLVRDVPELTLVWNDLQAREAEELHGIPRERIRITGAPVGDPWFGRQPSRSREDFCREVVLDPGRPIVLYLCSSLFVAPGEPEFVRRWLGALRARGGALGEAGYLIRPYPHNPKRWLAANLDGPQVRVWPSFGESPSDEASRRNYFDSMYYASAIVGINTTAQIEAAIVGRPVHTVLADEFRDTQEGTLHFRYLEADDFGLLHVGHTLEEHAAQVEASLRGAGDDGRNERFLRRFVRPLGLDRPATEQVVEAIEEIAARPAPVPDAGPAYAPPLRAFVRAAIALRKRSQTREKQRDASPLAALRKAVGRLTRDEQPIVAGPWTGDEISELLYWIPFLRWLQTANIGLRERLYVPHRPDRDAWYAGVGTIGEPPSGAARLSPELVLAARPELARQDAGGRIYQRMLEFAPLPGAADYTGPYGLDAYLAVLAGRPATVDSAELASPDDLLLARTFLGRPPYGRLQIVEGDAPWLRLSEADEYDELMRMRLKHVAQIREPLVLISQIQRSGGSLLSQLFDGHPEVHAHPHELYIGKPHKWDWPPLDLAAPDTWFETLYEPLVADWVASGYVKDDTARRRGGRPDEFPFVFSSRLQRVIFEHYAVGAQTEREVLDAYFTSYFNAWLDNQNLYSRPKKAVVAFTPRLAMELGRVERYFSAYPDGLLVSVVRDPRGWYASARGHRKYYADLEKSIGLWRSSTEAAIDAAARWPDRVAVLSYEELLEDTEGVMARLAARVGIAMTPELLIPTFNSRPIRANSSETVERTGIVRERGAAFRAALSADEIARIERLAGDLYERATPISLAT